MIEKRVAIAAIIFVLALTGVIALAVRTSGIGLPTCLTDVRPFNEGKVIEQAPKRYEIHYVARMWKFDPPEISVVPGSTADIYLSTADVTHGVNIIGTNFNLMAVPGSVNYARVKFDRTGDYLVVCNEYCGLQHQNMAGVIHVTEKAAAPPPPPAAPAALPGKALLEEYACTACHSIDGSAGTGPTLKGLFGSKRTLDDGTTVTADEEYLEHAIEKPGEQIVKGYDNVMPEMGVPSDDMHTIIQFIETLK